MRDCLLLPVKDERNDDLAFNIFETVEHYLKDSDWCFYKSNSEILSILSHHRNSLNDVLEDKKVLRIVSEKTQAGSLIRIKVINQIQGVELRMKIFGDGGEDVFFERQAKLDNNADIEQTLKNWLSAYEKKIPYDARVVSILGDQFTIDMGNQRGLIPGMKIKLVRAEGKKNHPLLKNIVSWQTRDLAEATIVHTENLQAVARLGNRHSREQLKLGDWAILEEGANPVVSRAMPEGLGTVGGGSYRFGKLGTLGLSFEMGKGTATSERASDSETMSGSLIGAVLESEVWITRNYWAAFEMGRGSSSLSAQGGGGDPNQANLSRFGLKAGYRYLPLSFFYGPRLDVSIGYVNYIFGLDTSIESDSPGFTEVGFKGIAVGLRGSLPITESLRPRVEFNFILSPQYSEKVNLYGQPDSSSVYNIVLGGSYIYYPRMTLDLSYDMTMAKAVFGVENQSSIEFRESKFKAGVSFTF